MTVVEEPEDANQLTSILINNGIINSKKDMKKLKKRMQTTSQHQVVKNLITQLEGDESQEEMLKEGLVDFDAAAAAADGDDKEDGSIMS